jgi:hypothetical protein
MSYADPSRVPENHEPPQQTEPAGAIASDSLAAESIKSGGDFAANDPSNPQPSSVPGAKSTLTNEDTSGAVPLPPAPSGAAREAKDALGLGPDERGVSGVKYPEGAGQPEFAGTTTSEGGYYGGPSSSRPSQGYDTSATSGDSDSARLSATGGLPSTSSTSGSSAMPSGSASSSGVRPYVDQAPTYAARTAGNIVEKGELQPKGENLTEGGIPETKTFLGDVGGPHDPGRVAEQDFEKINASVAGATVGGRQTQGTGEYKGGFEVLSGNERV